MLLRSLALILTLPCAAVRAEDDPRAWLEEIDSPRALEWVRARNDISLSELQGDARYRGVEAALRALLLAEDRIPTPELRGRWIYNFWQDAKSVRGVWRRVPAERYRDASPPWETVLDLDALSREEKENWVWKDAACLPPEQTRCILRLSRGGKDAAVRREFDTDKKAFVQGGFFLPEAKSYVDWLSADELLIGTDSGPGSLTKAGYPRIVKRWRRGEPLEKARTVYEGRAEDASASAWVLHRPEGRLTVITRSRTRYENDYQLLRDDGTLSPIPLPESADLLGAFDGRLLASLRQDWTVAGSTFPSGALLSWPVGAPASAVEIVWRPDAKSSLAAIATTRTGLFLSTLENVQGVLRRAVRGASGWTTERAAFPSGVSLSMAASDDFADLLLVRVEGFLLPPSIHEAASAKTPARWRSLPARFDASGLVVEQREARSRDGTQVPYFLIRRASAPADGSTPTLLFGYGGFENSLAPWYPDLVGKAWLEKGGAYAVANIRGGGEFGPRWHRAALKENRQRAFDDFLAVAGDLERDGTTSPRRLGIIGGSNGGLLVGVALTQRPELFNAVVCRVPLSDMLRYDKLLAGHLWVAEYGSPDDPKMAEVLRAYSPYHNVKAGARYPKTFVLTSTKDDRVHPGHARKLVARLEEAGHPVLYFENIEGGHNAAANLEQRVKRHALEFTYLFRQLFD